MGCKQLEKIGVLLPDDCLYLRRNDAEKWADGTVVIGKYPSGTVCPEHVREGNFLSPYYTDVKGVQIWGLLFIDWAPQNSVEISKTEAVVLLAAYKQEINK